MSFLSAALALALVVVVFALVVAVFYALAFADALRAIRKALDAGTGRSGEVTLPTGPNGEPRRFLLVLLADATPPEAPLKPGRLPVDDSVRFDGAGTGPAPGVN